MKLMKLFMIVLITSILYIDGRFIRRCGSSCKKRRQQRDILYKKIRQFQYNQNFPDERIQYEHLWQGYNWHNPPISKKYKICVLSDRLEEQQKEQIIRYFVNGLIFFIIYIILSIIV